MHNIDVIMLLGLLIDVFVLIGSNIEGWPDQTGLGIYYVGTVGAVGR